MSFGFIRTIRSAFIASPFLRKSPFHSRGGAGIGPGGGPGTGGGGTDGVPIGLLLALTHRVAGPSTPPPTESRVLLEDGSRLLQESGAYVLQE